ncbi:MAG TPA: response regulator transcription factor [Terriglobales bacterium]|jgi:two-component system response regulator CpxR|nr:response regulator transcription factor [Terriglobales bacterium]
MMAKILIVDDDAELCELVGEYLTREGFEVEAAHNGDKGLERALSGQHALVVLDIMLPGMTGLDVLRRLRSESRIPVLILTARGEDVDRIVGLEIGADDYLAKPFNPRELLARVRAILRRSQAAPATASAPVTVGDLELNPGARTVTRGGEPLELTAVEFSLLEALMRSAGQVVTREFLAQTVLGRRFVAYDRSIDMHVSKLRKKLGPPPDDGERIKTVRGVGYIYARSSGEEED